MGSVYAGVPLQVAPGACGPLLGGPHAGPQGEALAYDFVHEEVAGQSFAPSPDACGGHLGLRLSALELAQLPAYPLRTEVLLPKGMREERLLRLWGWYPAGQGGPYPGDEATARVWHPGDLYASAGPEEHTCVLRYPRQVEVQTVEK
ncbi:uncharacterized protein TTMY_0837 [Thermus thermophilus]|uniref:hypothetical protein n=1 Tax=Thermus thermophilus TaxID=274 RepID=UPI000909D41A|nr:hypothetical protein [Thermus thermophilus]BAW01241.1 uncharacterized protein TTMY_0837 [Thermus thermophilus]BDB11898.1 hypothetical protein TthTMY_16370 [Thermus thermophilus]